MEVEPDCVISSDSFEKYGLNERCRVSRERVQDFLERGLMSQDGVYQRYTEELSEKLTSVRRSDQPGVIEDIRQSFQRLRDPNTGYLSEVMFNRLITERLSGLEVDESLNGPALLFNICSSHAFYPFPKSYGGSGQLQIDEDGFVRAVCLLTLSPAPRYGPRFSGARHRYYSGNWGPHSGSYIALRGKDAGDFRRRLFRSLAVPDSTSTGHDTTIPVPRFMWYESNEGRDSEDETGQQVVVAEDESELSIDIVDVLSECPIEADRLTANPFRESYRIALPSLPKHTDDISVLFIPTVKLVALVKLAQQVQRESRTDLVATIEGLGNDGKVGWEAFESAMSEHSEFIADFVSSIFGTFTIT
ncbi:uncharacterized protein K460DRAFT_360546 [Cucurbitaria berberidis CBS 394.84]|uniref:Uncharacterized protein n=1 Tax=Cucurbitaria berberidis CBS 394.84 TaxID=1168544 RepID=A0A9P4GQZ2_9PLEO|nr:uncharacterized protein K460DRAFT_360546 [Cucurbitaria berberidis CBS 394.84]KAF1849699.1 hypothetical protein K460DRAFT_360546 [Cucurbitaria berberidis CBS 394.84]